MKRLNHYEGSIVTPRGFRAGAIFCDIKELGTGIGSEKGPKPDLAIILSDQTATVAGMFTTNQVKAAPVLWCIEKVRQGRARAIIANSGNANACTGPQGLKDVARIAQVAAKAIGCLPDEILVCSTGRIGVPLPVQKIEKGITELVPLLSNEPELAHQAAIAIMTSDTRPKEYSLTVRTKGSTIHIGGIAKGAGMIHPGMSRNGSRPPAGWGTNHATMLAFLTTDVAIEQALLQDLLEQAVAKSFNRIVVDGDMSTNDTVLILANGAAANPTLTHSDKNSQTCRKLEQAITEVCQALAHMIVDDSEGVHRRVLIQVEGAVSDAEADMAARAVARSPLVKTSWHGGDPNWGRIMDALGYSGATIDPTKVDIGYKSTATANKTIWAVRKGRPANTSFEQLCQAVEPEKFEIIIHLNLGKGKSWIYASDLTEMYVTFNKGNIHDPKTLGG